MNDGLTLLVVRTEDLVETKPKFNGDITINVKKAQGFKVVKFGDLITDLFRDSMSNKERMKLLKDLLTQ